MLIEERMPTSWYEVIIPIHRMEDIMEVCNYRGISLLNRYRIQNILQNPTETYYAICRQKYRKLQ